MEKILKYNICLLFGLIMALGAFAQKNEKPNIILIVADDLGYGDISYDDRAGSVTPQLNKLAREGMRFTNFYANSAACSPTRAALVTGRYQQRMSIEGALRPGLNGLPTSEVTVANYLKKEGYATAVYGKWHLGYRPEENPVTRGFDEFRGHLNSVDYRAHIGIWGNADWWFNDRLQHEEGYNSDLLANHAIRFINQCVDRDKPFFIYVPFSNIHFPWSVPEDPKFFHEGVDYSSGDHKLGPHSPTGDVTLIVRRMIQELDKSVGRIVETVKKNNLEENTLIFFTSDNGGYIHYQGKHHGQISDNGPLRGQKQTIWEGGIRVPAIAWCPGKIPSGKISNEIAITMDLLPTFLELAEIPISTVDSQNALDGVSILPVLLDNDSLPGRKVFWRFGGKVAVREGSWKMIYDKNSLSYPELYNLTIDIGEQNDVAKEHPEIINRLMEAINVWEKNVDK
jgi:arylsulfatase A